MGILSVTRIEKGERGIRMATDNIQIAFIEAAKELTIIVLDKMSPSEVTADKAAVIYKTVFKAVKEPSMEAMK
jgi:hypothetical protein